MTDETITLQENEIDLRLYFDFLRRRAFLIVLVAVLSGLVGFLVSNSLTPIYEASTVLLVSENATTALNEYNAVLTSERLARTYVEMISARPVLETLRANLDLEQDVETLKDAISISLVANTQLIEVKVQDPSPSRAALLANSLVSLFIEQNDSLQQSRFADSKNSLLEQIAQQQTYIDQIQETLNSLPSTDENETERTRLEQLLSQYRQSYTQLSQSYEQVRIAEAQNSSNIVQIESAVAPNSPVSPRILVNTLLSALAGVAIAVALILLIESMDHSIRSADVVKEKLGIRTLATIGKDEGKDSLVTVVNPRSPVSEAFRSLRTSIQFAGVDSQLKTIIVTSAVQEEGKTTVAANLAFVMSQLGSEVILVDADLRRPKLHKIFEVSNKKGLSNLFVNRDMGRAFSTQMQKTKHEHLNLLASGGIPPNPSELISTARMTDILKLAEESADLVIIDAPPTLPVTDAAVLAQKADGVIIVMVPGKTTMPMAKQTVETLRQVNAKIIGAVFNNVDLNSAYFSPYRNGYRYVYDHES